MSLAVDGRMAQAFKWDKFDYRLTISGKQADSLEKLFDLEFPTTGPFEISAAVNAAEGLYRLTDLVAHVQGAPGTPDIKITNGDASGGQENPLLIELQGKYGDAPLAFAFKSERTFAVSSQTTPWPLEARLHIADIKFDVRGTVTPATAGESFELDGPTPRAKPSRRWPSFLAASCPRQDRISSLFAQALGREATKSPISRATSGIHRTVEDDSNCARQRFSAQKWISQGVNRR